MLSIFSVQLRIFDMEHIDVGYFLFLYLSGSDYELRPLIL